MHRFRFPLAILIALTVAVAAAGTTFAKTTGSAAPAKTKTRAQLMAEHRGGTLKLVAKGAGGTLDPQVNYTLQYWQLYRSTYDGLLAFKNAAGTKAFTIVPDLVTKIPKPTNGGKTWTFTLRKGIKFSNGKPIQVRDVLYSFKRIFKVHSPTAGGFYSVLVGGQACLNKPATCTLAKGVVVNPKANTITFNLTRPDAEWLDKIAVPHASILPYGTPNKDVGTTLIPGHRRLQVHEVRPQPPAGARAQSELQAVVGQSAARRLPRQDHVLVRAPGRGRDHADRERAGRLDARLAAGRPPQRDRHQVPGTGAHQHALRGLVPADEREHPAVQQQARAPGGQLRDRPQRGRAHPRRPQARRRRPATLLPPGFPGHVDYCPYTKNPGSGKWTAPDLAKAKALVKQSGTAGQKVAVVVARTTRSTRRWRSTSRACSTRSATRPRSSRSRATSRSPTCRTPRTRCRSASRSGTRTTRRPRTSSTSCSAATRSIPAATRASTCRATATRQSTPR